MTIPTPQGRIKNFEKKQLLVSALALVIFCGLSIILNSLHLQSVAEENTKFLSRMVKIGDFREVSIILQEARLSNFKVIRYSSSQPDRSFVMPPKAEIFRDKSLWSLLAIDSITVPVSVNLSSTGTDEIIFEYDRFRLVPYAFLIWLVLNLVSIPQTRFMKKRLTEQFQEDVELEKKLVKSDLAMQVRHNLRTPVAALLRIPGKLPDSVAKERDLLEITIRQINDLVNKLDDRPKNLLSDQLEGDIYTTLVQAKRELELYIPKSIKFQFEIDDMISSTVVSHVPLELRAVLGNLVTNSIEAIEGAGQIAIKAIDAGGGVTIVITDNGIGIPLEHLDKVFLKDFSYGKIGGSGIGLFHAKDNLEQWGGLIRVQSTSTIGTTISLSLPVKDRAKWYLPRLKFTGDSQIFILDDQLSALELWRLRLEESILISNAKFARSKSDVANLQITFQNPQQITFLFDYDLGNSESGLDLLNKMPSAATRCLVTGHFDSGEIKAACLRSGLYLIPKSQISQIPIVVR